MTPKEGSLVMSKQWKTQRLASCSFRSSLIFYHLISIITLFLKLQLILPVPLFVSSRFTSILCRRDLCDCIICRVCNLRHTRLINLFLRTLNYIGCYANKCDRLIKQKQTREKHKITQVTVQNMYTTFPILQHCSHNNCNIAWSYLIPIK